MGADDDRQITHYLGDDCPGGHWTSPVALAGALLAQVREQHGVEAGPVFSQERS